MEVFHCELWGIRHVLDVAIQQRETQQVRGVKTEAVFSNSQAAI